MTHGEACAVAGSEDLQHRASYDNSCQRRAAAQVQPAQAQLVLEHQLSAPGSL